MGTCSYIQETQLKPRLNPSITQPLIWKDTLKFWYSLDTGAAHIVVISTEHSMEMKSPQVTWLKADLRKVDRTKTPFIIVMGHRSIYSSADVKTPSLDLVAARTLENLLVAHRVDLYVAADHHGYERTTPVANGVGRKKDSATVHIVVGTGGANNAWENHETNIWNASSEKPAWSAVRLSPVFGFLRFKVDHDRLKLEFVENEQGVLDTFTIHAPKT